MLAAVAALAACSAFSVTASQASAASVLTAGRVQALFAAHGIELGPGTLAEARARFIAPVLLLERQVEVLVPRKGHDQGLADLVVIVWSHPSAAQQASAAWTAQLHPVGSGWFAVDYNIVWSSTRQAEAASPILQAITKTIIEDACVAGGKSAVTCSNLVA